MEIIHKQVSELSEVEYRACHLANYRDSGYMQQVLYSCRHYENPGEVIMLWDGPKDTVRSLVGWALLTPTTTNGYLSVSRWIKGRSKYTAQFWVKRQYRKRGHAKTLMTEVKKLDPRPHVFPHDHVSGEFFSSFNVQVAGYDRHYLKRGKPKVA